MNLNLSQELKTEILELIEWLNKNRPYTAPHAFEETRNYIRITSRGTSVYCFIVKSTFQNKAIGKVEEGDLLLPASYQNPAKHIRGNLFERESWNSVFGEYGMRTLR